MTLPRPSRRGPLAALVVALGGTIALMRLSPGDRVGSDDRVRTAVDARVPTAARSTARAPLDTGVEERRFLLIGTVAALTLVAAAARARR